MLIKYKQHTIDIYQYFQDFVSNIFLPLLLEEQIFISPKNVIKHENA